MRVRLPLPAPTKTLREIGAFLFGWAIDIFLFSPILSQPLFGGVTVTAYANTKGEPEPIVTKLIELLPPQSHVLDIGCGEGRNAIPLARAGMRVEGWDKCRDKIAIMVLRAAEENLKINPVPTDMRDIRVGYDRWSAILTIRCMHFVRPAEAMERLKRIRATIIPGGYHAIVVFTANGALAKACKSRFFPTIDEVVRTYDAWEDEKGRKHPAWELVTQEVGRSTCLKPDSKDEMLENEHLIILARKPLDAPNKPL